jgi:hypothetical protein
MGIDDGTDKTIAHYCKVIDRVSAKIKPNKKSIRNQSLKVYQALLARHAKKKKIVFTRLDAIEPGEKNYKLSLMVRIWVL